MSSSTALVEVTAESGNGAAQVGKEEDLELPVDLSQLPSIPLPKSLLLLNNFVANTTRFLNHFAYECEERINKVSTNLTRVEIMLAILEAKLNSIPDLTVTDSDVQVASVQVGAADSSTVDPSATSGINIDSEELPDAGFGAAPPPPPPPAAEGDEHGLDQQVPPPPPPPPGQEGESNALVLASGNELAVGEDERALEASPFMKFKDDPVYAKYFTMQRLGMPDGAIVQKLAMDGHDPSIWNLDPDGPSPSVQGEGTIAAPPSMMPPMPPPVPPPPMSPASSVSSRGRPESLFGDGGAPQPPPPPPPPPLPESDFDESDGDDDDDPNELFGDPPAPPSPKQRAEMLPIPTSTESSGSTSSTDGVMKLKDDPAFAKYFNMRKLGLPDGAIRQKMMLDGVTMDILSMDPEGPSPNAGASSATVGSSPTHKSELPPPQPPARPGLPPPPFPPVQADSPALNAPPSRPGLPPPPIPPIDPVDLPAPPRPGLPPPPLPKYADSDDDSDF